jgi:hypothetical protein
MASVSCLGLANQSRLFPSQDQISSRLRTPFCTRRFANQNTLLQSSKFPRSATSADGEPLQTRFSVGTGSHTGFTVPKNRTGYHNHINSQEVTELIRELALVCEDTSIVSILNRLGYRTGNGNTWTEKRVQHVRHTKGFPACPPPEQRR